MDVIFPDNGLVFQLEQILTATVKYRLFTNNITPSLSDVVSTYTEAAWTGYAAVSQTWTNFTLNGVSGHNGFAIAAPITFSNSSGATVTPYGYFVTDSTGTILLAAARFDNPPVSILNGGSALVVPSWGDLSQLSS
jgi:hypothetical protein